MTNSHLPSKEELKSIYLFEGLDDKQLDTVIKSMLCMTLAAKERLFDFGDTAERFYYVKSGQIKLFRLSENGDEKVIEIIREGETFAEAIMFMKKNIYPVNSQAIMASEIFSFDMQIFTELLHDSIDSCFNLMASMSKRLRLRVEDINNLSLQDATHRLVDYLLQQLPEGVEEASEIHLNTPKSIIASQLSIQPETFSRILSRLSKKEMISTHGNTITLMDLQRLRDVL